MTHDVSDCLKMSYTVAQQQVISLRMLNMKLAGGKILCSPLRSQEEPLLMMALQQAHQDRHHQQLPSSGHSPACN